MEVRTFGKYTLLEHMGKGGVASVYRASDDEGGDIVAVKIFASGKERGPNESRLLRDREVKMLVSVQHPNIVTFFESGEEGDDAYYAMEFVENSLLKCMRDKQDFELVEKIHILRQTAGALVAIHRQGIVHRDIKPGNILLDQDPSSTIHVKLTDLGIAKSVSEMDISREHASTRVAGTARYLSPEQIQRKPMDGRSDIFSLGVVAYELVSGIRPFTARNSKGYLKANVEQEPPDLREKCSDLPSFLPPLIERMLAKDRDMRYDSETLARDLELVEQHLISGAPLVETENPASLFYDPATAETVEDIELETAPSYTGPSRLWALAIVAIGAMVLGVLYPRIPEEVPGDEPAPAAAAEPDPWEAARAAAAAGRTWQALELLKQVDESRLHANRRLAFREFATETQEALAQDTYEMASRYLADGRRLEAEILRDRMKEFFPDAQQTTRLAAAIMALERESAMEQRWSQEFSATYDLVSRQRFMEALQARKRLMQEFASDPEKAQAARRAIGDLLEQWGSDLLQRQAQTEEIRKFLAAAREESAISPDKPSVRLRAGLLLHMADQCRRAGDYAAAREHYLAASRLSDPELARRASQEMEDMVGELAKLPLEAHEFQTLVQEHGFSGDLWQGSALQRGGALSPEGALRLTMSEGSWESAAEMATIRPVRQQGFTLGLEFRVARSVMNRPGTRTGLELISNGDDSLDIGFDGTDYYLRRRMGTMSARTTLRPAAGDEDREWHRMGIEYDDALRELVVFLDDERLREFSVSLNDLRLRLYLEATSDPAAACEFRNLSFQPSGATSS